MLAGGLDAAAIRILSHADIASTLTPQQVIGRVEEAYLWKAQGKTDTFPLVFHEFEQGVADMDIKSGHLAPAGLFGLKLVSFFEENASKGLPPLTGIVALFVDETGRPLAVMEGTHLTGLRTGAAAAIGAKHLARPESRTFLVIGTGHQCVFQVSAMLCAMPGIVRVLVHSPLDPSHAEARVAGLRDEAQSVLGYTIAPSVSIEAAGDLELALRESDIVTTITPARKPLMQDAWVRPGTHFSCVGSDMPGKQELDPHTLARARVFVDDLPQCLAVGEVEGAVKEGILKESDIVGEIGAVLSGEAEGRVAPEDITVFDTTGIALQDLAAARAALDAAEAAGLGVVAPL